LGGLKEEKNTMKKIFKTHDEEPMPGERIGAEVEMMIDGLDLDTVNKEFVVIVEVLES
jgi:hypothetical protein